MGVGLTFCCHAEDRLPPSVGVNKGLVLDENSMKKLTTMQLSASDQDSEPSELVYRISKQTSLGHLEHAANPGRTPSELPSVSCLVTLHGCSQEPKTYCASTTSEDVWFCVCCVTTMVSIIVKELNTV